MLAMTGRGRRPFIPWDASSVLRCTEKAAKAPLWIKERCNACDGQTIRDVVGSLVNAGRKYTVTDFKYDIKHTRLEVVQPGVSMGSIPKGGLHKDARLAGEVLPPAKVCVETVRKKPTSQRPCRDSGSCKCAECKGKNKSYLKRWRPHYRGKSTRKKTGAHYMSRWRSYVAEHGCVPVENAKNCNSESYKLATAIRTAKASGKFSQAELREMQIAKRISKTKSSGVCKLTHR